MDTQLAASEKLIDETVSIATIPTTLAEIQRIVADPDGSVAEVAEVIEKDPAIAAKVLRLANSAVYGLQEQVRAINVACSVLGSKIIKNLVVQSTVLDQFSDGPAARGFDMAWLWDHSFKTAVACRLLSEACPDKFGIPPNDAYTCGLLHDVGKVVLLQSAPDRFGDAVELSETQGTSLSRATANVFGFSDSGVCARLARRWSLGDELADAVMRENDPEASPEGWARGRLVHVGSSIAHESAAGTGGWNAERAGDEELESLGLPEEKLASIRDEVRNATMSL